MAYVVFEGFPLKAYGNRIPLTDHFLWQRDPQRGDIIVFKRTGSGLPGSFFGIGDQLVVIGEALFCQLLAVGDTLYVLLQR